MIIAALNKMPTYKAVGVGLGAASALAWVLSAIQHVNGALKSCHLIAQDMCP
jgi:hypothetical protein